MTTLQEYLNQKYPTLESKEQLTELNLEKINQEREAQGETELLEGGELDLTEFKNLAKIEIYRSFLKTPLTKLDVSGLTNLKTLIWPDQIGDTEEEKKLWTELGISDLSTENNSRKKIVKEINRLVEILAQAENKEIKVHFATEKAPQEKLQGKDGLTEKIDQEFHIYLNLERKDKWGKFCPPLIFWTLAQELSAMGEDKTDKTPNFWNNLENNLTSLNQNLKEEYQKEFELLLTPATFPTNRLEIKELLTIYYPNLEEISEAQIKEITLDKNIVDQTWLTIKKEVLELMDQELNKGPDEEKLKQLAVKITLDGSVDQQYTIQINYHANSPLKEQIGELFTTIPLKEATKYQEQVIAELKKEKEQLPTPENFDKLQEQNKLLDNYLQDLTDEESYQKIKQKVAEIK